MIGKKGSKGGKVFLVIILLEIMMIMLFFLKLWKEIGVCHNMLNQILWVVQLSVCNLIWSKLPNLRNRSKLKLSLRLILGISLLKIRLDRIAKFGFLDIIMGILMKILSILWEYKKILKFLQLRPNISSFAQFIQNHPKN